MKSLIADYHSNLDPEDQRICAKLLRIIDKQLQESACKIWHGHPVWFIDDNPIVGYSRQKSGIRLMFWSGADFDEENLNVLGRKFKDASIFYTRVADIHNPDLVRWLVKAKQIQWDYKNLIKRKGKLEKLF